MSAPSGRVTDIHGAVYRGLKENEPLSVPEVVEILNDGEALEIDLPHPVSEQEVKGALQSLVKEGHVTHDTNVDSEGNVKWRTTDRPDLNPKPDGREILFEEIGLDAD